MLNRNFIDRIKLPFRKDKELYICLYRMMGFYPRKIELYKQALLHSSVAQRNAKGKPVNNERLEFLGDAVLDAAVGDIVFRHFPGKREGFLTNTRSKLVQRETLGRLAHEIGLDSLIHSKTNGTSHNSYMGGNAFEALVGAIYLDRGYTACMRFMKKRILAQLINIDKVAYKEVNFKSKLLEWSQKNRINLEFRLDQQKKDNSGSPIFCHTVMLEGIEGCSGEGYSKKESQQKAAKLTLEQLRRKPLFLDSVFAAKSDRTKMEEEPVQTVPDISQLEEETKASPSEVLPSLQEGVGGRPEGDSEPEDDFIVISHTEKPMRRSLSKKEKKEREEQMAAARAQSEADAQASLSEEDLEGTEPDEFDLSDISVRRQSREDIIAAAEEAAWKEV